MADRIRVLLAIGEMAGGGSQRQLIGILQRLDRARFQPYLYIVSSGGELLPEVPADVPVFVFAERHRGSRWYYPGHAHRARVRDMAEVLRSEKIDVVYDRTYHMTLISAAAARRSDTPRVSVIVTDPCRDFEGNRERYRPIKRWLLRQAYHSADRVVGVSDGVRQAAMDYYGLPPENALTLYNFFDIERIDRLMAEPLPPAEARQAGRFEVVAVGRLHAQKGYSFLLDAVRELVHARGRKKIHLRILGTGALEAELRAYVDQQRLGPHVALAGYRANPLPYCLQADLFCLSSLYEGMPNALVEAMLCRTPVLATDCPSGPREILESGRYGRLVPPADARALAEAIESAIREPQEWQGLVPAARAHIEQNFSPAAGIRKLEELLIDIVAQRKQAKNHESHE